MKKVIIYLICFLAIYVPFTWALSFDTVNGTSMLPTYNNGDLLLVSRRAEVKRNDIITIRVDNKTLLVKRVIGVPGDSIEIRSGHIFRNGKLLQEDYLLEKEWQGDSPEIIVKLGEIYVVGDNRNSSMDSRVFGCLKTDEIKGVVLIDLTKTCGLKFIHLEILFAIVMLWLIIDYILKLRKIKNSEIKIDKSDVVEHETIIIEKSWFED